MTETVLAADVAGETLELHAARAAYWRRTSTLLVADPHFGKAASFRSAGVFVPEATTAGTLSRLDDLLTVTRAARLIFLGDFLHAKEGRHPETLATVNAWRDRHAGVEMILVRGNHDKRAGDPPRSLRMTCVDAPLVEPPFAFVHHPKAVAGSYALAGHVHPAVHLKGKGRQYATLPCFFLRSDLGILPAFGEFTGFGVITPDVHDRVYVAAADAIHHVDAPADTATPR